MPRRAIPTHLRDAARERSIAELRDALAHAGAVPSSAATDPAAIVFDAYGTLFDLRAVTVACAALDVDAEAFAARWRAKQLEYSWLRSLMGRYADFAAVTAEALDYTLREFGLRPAAATRRQLLVAWERLDPFPEVRDALDRLAARPLAILSNGSPAMLGALLRRTDLTDRFGGVLSVDAAGVYKPDPRAYALAPAALGYPAERLLFVTANPWDAVGAKQAGFRVAWCARTARPFDTHGPQPDDRITDLGQLADLLQVAG